MHKKICVSKKITIITIGICLVIISFLISSSLLKTKTSLNSKAAPIKNNTAILGGSDTVDGVWPFVVYINWWQKKTACTGSLIAPGWVLTAAHCVVDISVLGPYNPDPNDFMVIAGSNNITLGTKYNVSNIYVKDGFTTKSKIIRDSINVLYTINDIALIKLQKIPEKNEVPYPLRLLVLPLHRKLEKVREV